MNRGRLRRQASVFVVKLKKAPSSQKKNEFYVDDLLKSTATTEQAIDLSLKLISLLREGGFQLTKFLTNCREVLRAIPEEERAAPTLDLDLDRLPINHTLGLCWDAETNEFYFTSISTEKFPPEFCRY